jgi:hypothetical protein
MSAERDTSGDFLRLYLKCDTPGCGARFCPLRPTRDHRTLRAQAARVGWAKRKVHGEVSDVCVKCDRSRPWEK